MVNARRISLLKSTCLKLNDGAERIIKMHIQEPEPYTIFNLQYRRIKRVSTIQLIGGIALLIPALIILGRYHYINFSSIIGIVCGGWAIIAGSAGLLSVQQISKGRETCAYVFSTIHMVLTLISCVFAASTSIILIFVNHYERMMNALKAMILLLIIVNFGVAVVGTVFSCPASAARRLLVTQAETPAAVIVAAPTVSESTIESENTTNKGYEE